MFRNAKDGREECPYCGAALYSPSELQKHEMSCTFLLENEGGSDALPRVLEEAPTGSDRSLKKGNGAS